jgi:hypothetical protein
MSTTTRSPSKRSWNQLPILLILFALTTIAWTANGCGVTGQTVRLDPAFDRTGTLRDDGVFIPMTNVGAVMVGDRAANLGNQVRRGFVTVTLAAIPPGANVTRVVLHLVHESTSGNPFDDFGTLTVDHVNVVAGVTAAEFLANPITPAIAAVPPPPSARETTTFQLDVTDAVKADLAAGRPISSFRLQFNLAPTLDDEVDSVLFIADPNDLNQQPYATATLQP